MITWHDEFNADVYDAYAQTYPLYRDTGKRLIELADVHPDMTILDLACGTGIVTTQISAFGVRETDIIGIDSSEAMLAIARRKLPRSRFFLCRAETISEILPASSVDVVVCNAAVWQIPFRRALQELHAVLKPDGRFAFNINTTSYLIGPAGSQSLLHLIHQVAENEYGIPPIQMEKPRKKISPFLYSREDMQEILERNSFTLVKHESVRIIYTQQELYEFLKIPVIISSYLPSIAYDVGKTIMENVCRQLQKPFQFVGIWHYYLVKRSG